jgi:hypothetical protein
MLLNWVVTDFDSFVAAMEDNIWRIAAVILFWPIYVAWIIFAWLFGL